MKENPIYKHELEKVFRYDVDSNVLERKWAKIGEWRVVKIDKANHSSGYILVKFNGRMIFAHRIIYTLIEGDIPDNMDIDHIDEVKTNNNISNLQLLSHRDNKAKSCPGLNPRYRKDINSYQVQELIWFGKKQHNCYFGCFETKTEAQRLCNAYNSQFGYGKPQYAARTRTPEYWRACMINFKDSYFNTHTQEKYA